MSNKLNFGEYDVRSGDSEHGRALDLTEMCLLENINTHFQAIQEPLSFFVLHNAHYFICYALDPRNSSLSTLKRLFKAQTMIKNAVEEQECEIRDSDVCNDVKAFVKKYDDELIIPLMTQLCKTKRAPGRKKPMTHKLLMLTMSFKRDYLELLSLHQRIAHLPRNL